jgi:hypothetical protein
VPSGDDCRSQYRVCYVEMAIPLPSGTKLKVGIWIGETKWWADYEVAYSTAFFRGLPPPCVIPSPARSQELSSSSPAKSIGRPVQFRPGAPFC